MSALSLNNIQMSDAGDFFCLMGDANHPSLEPLAASNPATLGVSYAALAITAPPVSASRYVSQTQVFSVTATGGIGALSYQWYKEGTLPWNMISMLRAAPRSNSRG